jgi:hypothetical protein
MELKINANEFEKIINSLISEGWTIEKIKKVEWYKIKFSKLSEDDPEKNVIKCRIPFLRILQRSMLNKICKCMDIEYKDKTNHEIIEELEKYKKGVIMVAYDSVIKDKYKRKQHCKTI